ncbi:MAG: DeoR/GlpR family DNA-binding transcription regulator [Rhodospirillales bacterium]
MITISPRQSEIIQLARIDGRVEVDPLATSLGVTPQTIRKDLNDLCESGLLQRIHGGAVYPSGVTNYAYDSRRVLAAEAKRLIGQRCAELIPDNSSVLLNIGTTTEQVAVALTRHQGLMVVTNNINVANILRGSPSSEVIIAGGIVRPADGGIVGEAAVDFIRQFRVDFAIIGASAIDEDGAILDYDYREVVVSQQIIRSARKTILVADHMKFERTAPVRIAQMSDISAFVTDQAPPAAVQEICDNNDVTVCVTATEGPADA